MVYKKIICVKNGYGLKIHRVGKKFFITGEKNSGVISNKKPLKLRG
jgi:hypothetical protein